MQRQATKPPKHSAPVSEPDAARLSALVDGGPEAVSIIDGHWRYVYVNLAFERMSRVTDDCVGREVWEVFPNLLGTPFELKFRALMADRRPTEFDYEANGRFFDVRVMPFGDGLAFFTRDVTDLHRATEELRQKEERYRTILNNEPSCVLLLHRDGQVLDSNPAGLRLLEVDDYDDLLGQPLAPFLRESDRESLKCVLARIFDGGTDTIVFEIHGCRGTRRRVEHRAVPLRDAKGEIVAALSTNIDITERQEAEDTLRRRALEHAMLASLGALALRDPDVDALTTKAADTVAETLGIPSRIALDLLRHHGLSDSGETVAGDPPLRLGPEDADFVRSTANLLMSAIERRRAEDALREREGQLRQATKMEAIGQLAGGVAHDFNNLLTIINVHTDLLMAQAQNSSMREDIEEIARAAARAGSLTRQLLTFSRKQVVQPKVIDLAHVAAGMEPMLRRLIGEDVHFDVSVAATINAVLADEGEIEQVIINLVVNARDAMPQGGALNVSVANVAVDEALCNRHPSLRAGDYVQITVADSGMGMTAETAARAFEPFFTTKEPGRGTGLGLATVYGIVKQSGGAITVESEPGAGTTFCVYLPVIDAEVSAPVVAKPRRHSTGAGETILLVEDEDSVRRLAQRVLEAQGYAVLVAINGEDALRLASDYAGVIDLLLSDVVMPGLGGRQLAERLTLARPEMEVLLMSGYTDDDILRRGLLERGQRLLQKPFSAPTLAHEVRSALDARMRRRNAARAPVPAQ